MGPSYWPSVYRACEDDIVRFLLTAGAIGIRYKIKASISGAEVGCQGSVGSACSVAAGALTDAVAMAFVMPACTIVFDLRLREYGEARDG